MEWTWQRGDERRGDEIFSACESGLVWSSIPCSWIHGTRGPWEPGKEDRSVPRLARVHPCPKQLSTRNQTDLDAFGAASHTSQFTHTSHLVRNWLWIRLAGGLCCTVHSSLVLSPLERGGGREREREHSHALTPGGCGCHTATRQSARHNLDAAVERKPPLPLTTASALVQ